MATGHIDELTADGILTGWFIGDAEKNSIEFAVVINNTIVALGRRAVERADVEQVTGVKNAGFQVKILPRSALETGTEIQLIEMASANRIATNFFVVPEHFANSASNEKSRVEKNAWLVREVSASKLADAPYLDASGVDAPSETLGVFYLSMVSYWGLPIHAWVDVEMLRYQQSEHERNISSPLEFFMLHKGLDLLPNIMVQPRYLSSMYQDQFAAVPELTSYTVMKRWIELAKDGVLLRPNPLVRGGFSAEGLAVGSRKVVSTTLEKLETAAAGKASFAEISQIAPIFDSAWLQNRPLKAKENGSSVYRSAVLGAEICEPNAYFLKAFVGKYSELAWMSDAGTQVTFGQLRSCLHPELSVDGVSDEVFDLDAPLHRLRELKSSGKFFDYDMMERIAPRIFKQSKGDERKYTKFEYSRFFLEQIGFPVHVRGLDFTKPLQTFNLSQLRRLGTRHSGARIDATVIIPTLGRLDLVFSVLRSISVSMVSKSIEVIVSDDGSDVDFGLIEYFFPCVRILRAKANRGFLLNVNSAAKHASGDLLLIVNNDVVVHRNAIDELVDSLNSVESCAVMGGMVLSLDGVVQEIGSAVWNDGGAWNLFRGWAGDDPSLPKNLREADYVSGCWMAVKKTVWEDLGGFSDYLAPAYCEDLDFCLKAWRAGFKVMVNPASVVTHIEGETMGRDEGSATELKRYQLINREKIRKRWGGYLAAAHASDGELSPQFRAYKLGKPIAVIFDHYLPEPDRDAGSKSIMALIDAIVSLGTHYIIMVPANNHYSKYAKPLEKKGIEVISGTAGWRRFDALLERAAGSIDLVLCSRLSVAKQFEWHIAKCAGTKVLYIHDVEEARLATGVGMPESKMPEIYRAHVERWRKQYSLFEYVLTCSETEQREIGRYLAQPVYSFPVYDISDEFSDLEFREAHNGLDILFVGSVNHPPNLMGIEWFVHNAFAQIRNKLPNVKLHLIGSGFESCTFLQRDGVVLHGQVSDTTLKHLYGECDVAIAPLIEGAGMKGKVVEALNYGLPCIGTDIAYQGLEGCRAQLPVEVRDLSAGAIDTLAERILTFAKVKNRPSRKAISLSIKRGFGKNDPAKVMTDIVTRDR